jgi:lauroyl/myristoyl acyltransferase
VQRFFEGRRAASGIRTLSGGATAAAALARLRAGGWIAALADRACSPRRLADLAGSVPIDRAPLVLARRAGARILAGVSWRGEDGVLHVRLLAPFTLSPEGGGLSLAQGAARLQRFFDEHVRAHPTQWYEWAAAAPAAGSETRG